MESLRRRVPLLVLVVTVTLGVAQLVALPPSGASVSLHAIVEGAFLLMVLVGLFTVFPARESKLLSDTEIRAIYLPLSAGIGMIAIRATTDVLDEFRRHPEWLLTVLEDGAMIVGVGLLFAGLRRWFTLRQRYEEQLRRQRNELDRQNDRLETFAEIVSHDLRNPLTVAMGRLEVAESDGDERHFDAMGRALERMETIIDDVLTLSRIGPDAITPVELSVQTVSEAAWENVETKRAELVTEFTGDMRIAADETTVQRLFENLFRNAVEHGGESVTVHVGPTDSGFYIEDTGTGIPEDDREQVFESGYSTESEGTGFGLDIVRQIVDAHGWSVRLQSSAEGGARFEICVDETAG